MTVIECDTLIQNTFRYNGQKPTVIQGRGGTDFFPAIDFANKKLNPDAIIYFTDGYALPPKTKSRCPILWVITANGIDKKDVHWQALWGQKIRMS